MCIISYKGGVSMFNYPCQALILLLLHLRFPEGEGVRGEIVRGKECLREVGKGSGRGM